MRLGSGSLLARGEADEAIAKFALSIEKGPHFAEPIGEVG